MLDVEVNYSKTFSKKPTRDFYRGKSFHFSGKWASGVHYYNDDYVADFIVKDSVLLICAKSHLSTSANEPTSFIKDELGNIVGVNSEYWDFVIAGFKGKLQAIGIKIVDNYWYTCNDTSVPEEEQIWINTGQKARFEFSDLTPAELIELQQPGIDAARASIADAIVQNTGSNLKKIMSQNAVTVELNKKAEKDTVQNIVNVIPSEASTSNLLADRAYVDDNQMEVTIEEDVLIFS